MLCRRFISRRVRVTGEAGSRRRLSVAGSHGARAGFLPILAGKASLEYLLDLWRAANMKYVCMYVLYICN